jgi:hypothetical protein
VWAGKLDGVRTTIRGHDRDPWMPVELGMGEHRLSVGLSGQEQRGGKTQAEKRMGRPVAEWTFEMVFRLGHLDGR